MAQYHHAVQVSIRASLGAIEKVYLYGDVYREAFSVLKEAGCSDEALCYEM